MTEKDKEIQDLRIEVDKLKDENSRLNDFILWIIDEIMDKDYLVLNYISFPELVCRKLVKLGYLCLDGDEYWRV